jgi:leukotriene-A4 hydrolase
LERLQIYQPLPSDLILHLGKIYQLSESPNAELRLRYYQLAFQDSSSICAKQLVDAAIKWVIGEDGSGVIKGRMKFCRPILQACSKVERQLVLNNWKKAKSLFHPIAQKLVDKVRSIFFVRSKFDL